MSQWPSSPPQSWRNAARFLGESQGAVRPLTRAGSFV